jgi:hypothetical protein
MGNCVKALVGAFLGFKFGADTSLPAASVEPHLS